MTAPDSWPRGPDFFLVGAPKCGTSAMTAYLASHPGVYVCPLKEIHFFAPEVVGRGAYGDDREAYLRYFREARPDQRIGEASTLYLYSPEAPGRLARFNPAARILVMLRDPVEMVYALHAQVQYTGRAARGAVTEVACTGDERCRMEHGWRGVGRLADVGRYAAQLERYLARFAREQIHVVLFEEFARDPASAYAGVLRHLGVDAAFRPSFPRINANRRIRSRAMHGAVSLPPAPVRRAARLLFGMEARRRLVRWLKRLNSRERTRAPMDPGLRQRLREELEPDVRRLEALLGRDLRHWRAGAADGGRTRAAAPEGGDA